MFHFKISAEGKAKQQEYLLARAQITTNDNNTKQVVRIPLSKEEADGFDCKMFKRIPQGEIYKWKKMPAKGGGVTMVGLISTAKKI